MMPTQVRVCRGLRHRHAARAGLFEDAVASTAGEMQLLLSAQSGRLELGSVRPVAVAPLLRAVLQSRAAKGPVH
jgi:hypothetical protein